MSMLRIKNRLARKQSFTLTELLVVIAIISILLAFSLPALKSAKNAAKSIQCVNNLHQLYNGIMLYVGDSDGVLPPANPPYGYWGWDARLYVLTKTLPNTNYPKNNSKALTVYQCPSSPYRIGAWYTTTYPYNYNLGWSVTSSGIDAFLVRIAQVTKPAQAIMLADGSLRGPTGYPPGHPSFPEFQTWYAMSYWSNAYSSPGYNFHPGNRANILFVDGHVEPLTQNEAQARYNNKTLLFSKSNGNINTDHW